MKHNKLVRDNIPEIIIRNGVTPKTRVLDDAEYELELTRKLMEEVSEYVDASSVEELADILEVVYALAALHKASPEDLEKVRLKKATERGAFTKRIYLIES